jgi:hypothetical protein
MAIINMNEAVTKIKQIGTANTRIIESSGACSIEVYQDGKWDPLVVGVTKRIAEDIVSQATNRVILG